mgnify:CR=1 FL=1
MGYSFINHDQEYVCSLMGSNGAPFRNSQLYGIIWEYCSTTLYFGNAIWFFERTGFICRLYSHEHSNQLTHLLIERCQLLHVILFNVPFTLIRHVNNIPTMQFFCWNFQKYSVKIIYAIIDRVCLGIPKKALWDTHYHALLQMLHFTLHVACITLRISLFRYTLHSGCRWMSDKPV